MIPNTKVFLKCLPVPFVVTWGPGMMAHRFIVLVLASASAAFPLFEAVCMDNDDHSTC
jgi:hypothetical protein